MSTSFTYKSLITVLLLCLYLVPYALAADTNTTITTSNTTEITTTTTGTTIINVTQTTTGTPVQPSTTTTGTSGYSVCPGTVDPYTGICYNQKITVWITVLSHESVIVQWQLGGSSKRATTNQQYVVEVSLSPYSGWNVAYRGKDSNTTINELSKTNQYYMRVSYYVDLAIQASATYNFSTTAFVPTAAPTASPAPNVTNVTSTTTGTPIVVQVTAPDNSLSEGAIIGIAVGGAAFVAMLAAVIIFLAVRHRRNKAEQRRQATMDSFNIEGGRRAKPRIGLESLGTGYSMKDLPKHNPTTDNKTFEGGAPN